MVLTVLMILVLLGIESIPSNINTNQYRNTINTNTFDTNTQDWYWLILVCLISRHRLGILILTNTGFEYWYRRYWYCLVLSQYQSISIPTNIAIPSIPIPSIS